MSECSAFIDYEKLYEKLKAKFGKEVFDLGQLESELPREALGDPWHVINTLKELHLIDVQLRQYSTITTPWPSHVFRMLERILPTATL